MKYERGEDVMSVSEFTREEREENVVMRSRVRSGEWGGKVPILSIFLTLRILTSSSVN